MSDVTQRVSDQRSVLEQARLFAGVPRATLAAVVAGCETRELAANEKLLVEGTQNDLLYLLLSGSVNVLVADQAHPHLRLGPGECVGELSLIDGQLVSADVVATTPTQVLAIDRDELWSLIDASPEVARNLLRILAGRVRHDDAVLAEASRQRRHFEHMATLDGLTGLRNRRWLDDAFARQLLRCQRSGQPACVLMVDVDHFKQLNDRHGHVAGDAVLCRLARVMSDLIRPQDLLARYGGEEFAALLPGAEVAAGQAAAERLRLGIAAEPAEGAHPRQTRVTVSIGVARAHADEPLAQLLERADAALYRAKAEGRNRVVTAD